jgi:protein involved in polysaccharide export with SLBB domain
VIGPVKTPGSYKYVSGMIVLHAMALAGGFERKGDASAVMSAYVREREREDAVLLRLRRLYARQARLTSERDGRTEIKASAALERIADPREISRLIEAEMAQFVATRRMDEEKVQQAKSALENLRTEQQALKSKLAQITQHAGRRSERLANLQRLQARGNVQTTTLAAVEADLFEIEARRKDADVRLAQVTQNIEQSERTLVQVPLDRKNVVDRELNATVEEITEAEALRSSQRALTEWARANLVENVNRSGEPSASFEIVRRVATGTVVIAAAETSPLQPGDVLRVRLVPIAEGTGGKSAKHGSSESDTRGW